jgi:hypothetical protein
MREGSNTGFALAKYLLLVVGEHSRKKLSCYIFRRGFDLKKKPPSTQLSA